MSGWDAYYQAVAGRPPRKTLVGAADAWEAEFPAAERKRAVDIGCGDGRDTVELLRRGWQVTAIDADAGGLERLRGRPDLPPAGALTLLPARMEDATWGEVDLVNASFVLPFCRPAAFFDLWTRITRSLASGGRFAGQLFGPDDTWAKEGLIGFSRAEIDTLFTHLPIESIDEVNAPGVDAAGQAKQWHVFHVVARKP